MNNSPTDSAILSFVRWWKKEANKMQLSDLIIKLVILLLSLILGSSVAGMAG